MQKRGTFIFISICLGLSIGLAGCAKKAGIQEVTSEKVTVAEKKAQAESDADRAAREKAVREAEMRDQERQRAEREKAEAAQSLPLAGLDYIYFDFDEYKLKPEARKTLQQIAASLKAGSGYKLLIEGNCDERGTVEYNLALGERRTTSAKAYLVTLGIDQKRISTISYGKERPVDPGHSEAAWAKDRNDHFVVKK